jgi:aryl-alcohol dehydrogenase-like predicted oxidoreductase
MEEMVKIADEKSATVSQVALAWLVTQPNVVAIPGASAISQLETNAASADLELNDKEWETLASYRPF